MKFTKDFWNVDRRRSETKEVLSKKITQHARYKTCTFLVVPVKRKREITNCYVLLAGKPPQQFGHVLPKTQGKMSQRQRQ